ncbi:MAG: sugar ABC transporter substrate-binding protein, partial [Mobilitalea sp.]
MKRIFSFLLVITLCLLQLTACSPQDSEKNTDKEQTSANNALTSIYSGELERNVTIRVLEND